MWLRARLANAVFGYVVIQGLPGTCKYGTFWGLSRPRTGLDMQVGPLVAPGQACAVRCGTFGDPGMGFRHEILGGTGPGVDMHTCDCWVGSLAGSVT